jgi:hypothetical protein
MQPQEGTALSSDQQAMSDLWDEHMRSEFETSSVEATLETMVEDPYVNHVPVMTGGVGQDEVRHSTPSGSLRSSRSRRSPRSRAPSATPGG